MASTASRPLEGIRILDLTVALAGPYGSLVLAGLGAEVIRVEAPGGGDIGRTNPPFVGSKGISFDAPSGDDVSLSTLNRARNKKSVTIDVKNPKGYALLIELAKHCDVLMENFSEGTTAKLKIDYEQVRKANPRIVYASVKAFGEPSPYPTLKGMDIIVQAMSGLMEVTGFADGPPTRVGIPIADLVAPLFAVNGILAALIQRGRTGEGEHVQVSMLDCMASLVAEEHFDVMGRAGFPLRSGNSHDRLVPFGVWPTRDGHVAIIAFSPEWMRALGEAMGQPGLLDDPRFANRAIRMQHAKAFNAIVEAWTRAHTCEEVVRELGSRGVPHARVRSPDEVLHDAHLQETGAVVPLEHPTLGRIDAIGTGLPIRFAKSKTGFDQPAQQVGASTEEVLGGILKLSKGDIEALRAAGII